MRILATAKACGRKVQGNYFLNAYVGSDRKPPESMVQGTVLTPMLEYVRWKKSMTSLPDSQKIRHVHGRRPAARSELPRAL
jgi:hypothetical protein